MLYNEIIQSVTEMLELNHMILIARFGLESSQGLRNLICEEFMHLAYGTLVVLLRDLLVPEINHERAPEVFLRQ